MSTELASDALGAAIVSASSYDANHPPSAIIDGNPSSFWVSTGSFPQEFVLQLGQASTLKSVDLVSCGVRSIELYKTEGIHANSWEKIAAAEADDADGEIQRLSLNIPPRLSATFLRLKVITKYCFNVRIQDLSWLLSYFFCVDIVWMDRCRVGAQIICHWSCRQLRKEIDC
jgi:hypothetical protein